MKKLLFTIILTTITLQLHGQVYYSADDLRTIPAGDTATLTQRQRDSLLFHIHHILKDQKETQSFIGRYKVYPTENMYTSLLLDTATGEVDAIQIGLGDNESTLYLVSEPVLGDHVVLINGKFELYPTKNMYNFILLDTSSGIAYQVQWHTEKSKRGRWVIL